MSDASPSRDSSSELPLVGEPLTQEAHRARAIFFLAAAVACMGVCMAIQGGLNENFVVLEMKVTGLQRGILESSRESCGIMALGVLALLAGFAEPLVGMFMLMLVGIGCGAYALVHGYGWLVAASMVWSMGLHVWMPLPNSMTIAIAEPGKIGHRLGQLQAAGAAGTGAGLVAAIALTFAGVPMRPLYVVSGAFAFLAAFMLFSIPRRIKTPGPRVVLRRKFGLYYLLCLLEGWRKQISICFAPFLLVKVFGTPLWAMLVLAMAVQGVGYLASPPVGRLIDRIGERRVLLFYYSGLAMFFVAYAFVPNVGVLYAVFIVDSAFFVFGMSLTTYVGRIADRSELTPTLSMGVAMNHVAAVAMPLVGGLLWKLGYRWLFLTGVVAAAFSIFAALRVPKRRPAEAQGPRTSTA